MMKEETPMSKGKILLCSLALLLTVFSGAAFAAASTTPLNVPYASIIAYNEDNSNQGGGGWRAQPNVSTLGVLDIVNMTPWNISFGPGQNQPMLPGMTTLQTWEGFWLAGFNNKTKANGSFGGSFAFHSMQVALNNLNNGWKLKNSVSGFSQPMWYDSIPIVFNSSTFSQSGNTAALSFIVTSTTGFDVAYDSGIYNYPATALSFGDGTNNYGWASNDTMIYSGGKWKNTSHFLTIQGLGSNATNWKPIAQNLGGIITRTGVDGATPSTPVKGPVYLNISGLAYKNFSAVAGDNANLDLVVILQATGYGDMQLLFLAVPTANNGFLNGL
jgi:hypothetical protein